MLGDSGRAFENRSGGKRRRRKRVQRRSTRCTSDLWDPALNEVSHHSIRRLKRYRIRRALWIFQVIACLVLGLSIPYVAKWSFEKFVFGNDSLRLTQLHIETSGSLSQTEIAAASGVKPGGSILRLDLEEVERRLEELHEVESVGLSREFPDGLRIRVEERIPLAWLSCPSHKLRPLREGSLLMDKSGVVFPCRGMSDDLVVLPTIEINDIPRPIEGEAVASFQLGEALNLINTSRLVFDEQEMEILDVRAMGNWGLLCRYPEDLLVTFDINRIEEGLLDLAEILKKSEKSNLSLATINLVSVKNIPVTFHSKMAPENW